MLRPFRYPCRWGGRPSLWWVARRRRSSTARKRSRFAAVLCCCALLCSKTHKKPFESGQTDVFVVLTPDLGALTKVVVQQDGAGTLALNWKLHSIRCQVSRGTCARAASGTPPYAPASIDRAVPAAPRSERGCSPFGCAEPTWQPALGMQSSYKHCEDDERSALRRSARRVLRRTRRRMKCSTSPRTPSSRSPAFGSRRMTGTMFSWSRARGSASSRLKPRASRARSRRRAPQASSEKPKIGSCRRKRT